MSLIKKRHGSVWILVLAAIAAFSVGVAMRMNTFLNPDTKELKQELKIEEQFGVLNVLVLGVDELENVHRSDTVILARIDIDNRKAVVMSIPRDTRVPSQKHKGYGKLNHAYAFGGIEGLRDTVVNLTGVPINNYLILNYNSFPKIVDAVGGVDLTIKKRMKYTDKAQNLHIDFHPGPCHLNGTDALKYVRFRMDAMGDLGRMKRQQQFAAAFMKKVLTPSILPRLPDLVELVLSEIKTDVPLKTGLRIAGRLKSMRLPDVKFFTMPGSAADIDGISYFSPDLQKASEELNLSAQEKGMKAATPAPVRQPEAAPDMRELHRIAARFKEPIAVLNGTGRSGLAAGFSRLFEKNGIAVGYIGNAKHNDFRYTIIRYSSDKDRQQALDLAALCGIPEARVKQETMTNPVVLILGKNDNNAVSNRIENPAD